MKNKLSYKTGDLNLRFGNKETMVFKNGICWITLSSLKKAKEYIKNEIEKEKVNK